MTIARAHHSPTRHSRVEWWAADGLLSTLLRSCRGYVRSDARILPLLQSAAFQRGGSVVGDSKRYKVFEPPAHVDAIRGDLLRFTFPLEEYRGRYRKVQQMVTDAGLDYLFSTYLPPICWITGYETLAAGAPAALVIPAEGEPTLMIDDFEAFNTLTSSWVEDVVTFPWAANTTGGLIDLAKDRGLSGKRLGWDYNRAAVDVFDALQDAVDAEWVPMRNVLEEARSQKSPAEIEQHRRAGRLTVLGMEAAREAIRPGAIDNDIANAGYDAIIGGGSERMGLQPIVTVGRRSGIPHTTFRRKPIEPGKAILMEFGACVNRYTSPMIRAGFLGQPNNPLWVEMWEACKDAVENTIRLMRPGAEVTPLAEEASQLLFSLPEGVYVDGNRGYSMGLSFPAGWGDCPGLQIATEQYLPSPRPSTYATLKPGHTFHVRAMARHVGFAGVGVSETVTVTEDGAEVLTSNTRELAIIE